MLWYLLATSSLAWHVATPAPLTADTVYHPASFLFALWIRRQILPVLSCNKLGKKKVFTCKWLEEENEKTLKSEPVYMLRSWKSPQTILAGHCELWEHQCCSFCYEPVVTHIMVALWGHQGPFAAPTASELDEHAAYLSPIAMLLHGPCSYCWNSAASCCALKTRLWASFLSGTWACSSCAVCLASQLLLLLTSSLKCDLTNSGYCFLVH